MSPEKIQRINELARKSKTPEGLTAPERAEQAALRKQYIADVKNNLRTQLENTDVIDETGQRRPLTKKDTKGQ